MSELRDTIENTVAAQEQPLKEGDSSSPQDYDPVKLAEHWEKEVTAAQKWLRKFHDNGKRIEKIYLSQESDATAKTGTHFNLFWANVQVYMAVSYANLPNVDVSRKFKDYQDDVARVAGIMVQRILNSDTWEDPCGTDEAFKNMLLDRMVPGMGVSWCRYDYDEVQMQDPTTQQQYPVVADESCPVDHVRWDDFLYSPCRTWVECRWVARARYMTKEQLIKKFGQKIADQVKMDVKSPKTGEYNDPQRSSPYDQARVWEIWCKDSKKVYWYGKGCQVILDWQSDPLELTHFFPVPRPLMATILTNNFISRPEYVIVQDQYSELEMVTQRISLLTEACRVVGAYDKESGALKSLIQNTNMNDLVPVDNWAMFAERGGIKGVVDWFPLDQVTNALEKLTNRKRELMQEIYEILGLSDLMRGMTKASETATAQQLKAQFGMGRVDVLKKNIAKFFTETMQIRGEIVAKHWDPQRILEKSQIMMTPDAKFAQQAVQLLKTKGMYEIKLEVLADTIAQPDWEQEKRQRTEFLQAISQFIGMSMPLIQAEPGATPFLVQIMQWAAAGFQSGKTLEGVLDQALQQLQMSLTQPKPPQVTPEDRKNLSAADKNVAEADFKRAEMGLPPIGHMKSAQLPPPVPPQQPGGPAPQRQTVQ